LNDIYNRRCVGFKYEEKIERSVRATNTTLPEVNHRRQKKPIHQVANAKEQGKENSERPIVVKVKLIRK